MALTLDTFLGKFPEFRPTSVTLIAAHLADALAQIDSGIWGTKADIAQGYLTAHHLTLSPTGQNARMIVQNKTGGQPTTVYFFHYKNLQRQVGSGFRVAGAGPTWCLPRTW